MYTDKHIYIRLTNSHIYIKICLKMVDIKIRIVITYKRGKKAFDIELAVQDCICNVCFLNLSKIHGYSIYTLYPFGIIEIFHINKSEQTNFQFLDGLAWQNQYAFPKVLIEHLIFKNNFIFLFFPKIKRSQKAEEEKAVYHMLPFPFPLCSIIL